MQFIGNEVRQVLILVGIPASGKSTFARKYKFDNDKLTIILERDIIRENLFNCSRSEYSYTNKREKEVTQEQSYLFCNAMLANQNVVIADTNLNSKTRDNLLAMIDDVRKNYNIKIQVTWHIITTPLQECIKRNIKRQHSVPESVLIRMQGDLRKLLGEYYHDKKNKLGLPECVIVDIDGTVADHQGIRHPFEWGKVYLDKKRTIVADYVQMLLNRKKYRRGESPKVIFMSGRDSKCALQTAHWILDNFDVSCYDVNLYMRPYGDNRPDTVIKEELFDKHIKNKYYVSHIIDDRKCMVQHWQSMGFDVFDVGNGVSDF